VHTEPSAAWKIIHTPDLDGDGKADLLWWNSTSGQVYAMLMNGAAIKAQGMVYTEANTAWRIAAVGHFSGPGASNQLLWRNVTTGQVYLMTVTYSGGFTQTGQMIYTEPNTSWRIVATPDLNGDGRSDILWRHVGNGQVYGMLMNGGAITTGALVHTEPDLNWKIVTTGDFTGEGKADILWRSDLTGQLHMMLMNGLSITSRDMVYTEPSAAWRILGITEYNKTTQVLGTP
jgi:peptidyl-Asp metalloendopeptidase